METREEVIAFLILIYGLFPVLVKMNERENLRWLNMQNSCRIGWKFEQRFNGLFFFFVFFKLRLLNMENSYGIGWKFEQRFYGVFFSFFFKWIICILKL
jgi:hypothetical protein